MGMRWGRDKRLSEWERYERNVARREQREKVLGCLMMGLTACLVAFCGWLAMVGAIAVFG